MVGTGLASGGTLGGDGMSNILVAENVGLEASPALGWLPCAEMEFLVIMSCAHSSYNHMLWVRYTFT